ncbi:hypothetical protein J6590_011583 [Homalodisca vitripennis]|nr:hypothetical protein J6590_011583 [Homalodisca vitripennis]
MSNPIVWPRGIKVGFGCASEYQSLDLKSYDQSVEGTIFYSTSPLTKPVDPLKEQSLRKPRPGSVHFVIIEINCVLGVMSSGDWFIQYGGLPVPATPRSPAR